MSVTLGYQNVSVAEDGGKVPCSLQFPLISKILSEGLSLCAHLNWDICNIVSFRRHACIALLDNQFRMIKILEHTCASNLISVPTVVQLR